MKRLLLATIATGALMMGTANAAIIDLVTDAFGAGVPAPDAIQIGGTTAVGSSGINYSAFAGTIGALGAAANLTGLNHNAPNDRGMGVCSEGSANCMARPEDPEAHIGGVEGDAAEVLRLEKPSGNIWSDIIISSLDRGAGGDNDNLFVAWGNSASGAGATSKNVSLAEAGVNGLSTKSGSIWASLTGAEQNAIANSQYLFFYNKTDTIDATLVNAVGLTPVRTPEPASLALFGAALAGLGLARRRK